MEGSQRFVCVLCNQVFASEESLSRHSISPECCSVKKNHDNSIQVGQESSTNEVLLNGASNPMCPVNYANESQYGEWTTQFVILNKNPLQLDTCRFLVSLKESIHDILKEALTHHQQITYNLSLYINCTRQQNSLEVVEPTTSLFIPQKKSFTSKVVALRSFSEIDDSIDVLITLISVESNEEYSQCVINDIVHLEVWIKRLPKMKGAYIELPRDIRTSRGVVNMKNFDNFCFKWAIIAALADKKVSNRHRVTLYQIPDIAANLIETSGINLNFSGLRFPLKVWDTKYFERKNPCISVNVFGFEMHGKVSRIVGPLYRTRMVKPTHINLLYFEDEPNGVCHYAWIRAMSRLLRKQLSNVHSKVEICNTCLEHFSRREGYEKHKCHRLMSL